MKALVTGGAGFIGSHAVDALIDGGHEVAVVDDLSSGTRDYLNPKAQFFELDIRSDDLASVFSSFQPTHVAHLAAQIDVRISVQRPVHDASINVVGTINLLENCVKSGIGGFVFVSTGGAMYGEGVDLPVSEAIPAAPVSHYGTSKLAGEYYVKLYRALYGLPYMILRFGNIYGPRQNPHGEAGVCAILGNLMLDGKTPTLYGHGEPLRDYVYVGDAVRAILLGLDKPADDTVNIASGTGTSVARLFEIIKRETGFEGEPNLAPLRPGEVDRIYLTNARAAERMGWRPEVSLEEGLARTVQFLREQRSAV